MSETPQPNLEVEAQQMDAVTALASQLHENWRASRLQEDGSFEPRIKSTSDESWIAKNGVAEVDIANTDFIDLPKDWQQENADAAEVAQGLLEAGIEAGLDVTSNDFIEEASSHIHDAWLARENNSWAKGSEVDVPYADLSAEEQAKDREQIALAVALHTKAI